MYEASIARREEELVTGKYQVDEAQTRDWLQRDRTELADWKRRLAEAERAAIIPEPLT